MRLFPVLLAALISATAAILGMAQVHAASPDLPQFKDVKRVVFLGDSITQAGDYVVDIECWLMSCGQQIEILNLGLASETACDLTEAENEVHLKKHGFSRPFISERIHRVLFATKPDLVFVCYGMNDAGSLPADASGDQRYAEAITRLRDTILRSGVKQVVLLTPPVRECKHGEWESNVHDQNLTRYTGWLLSMKAKGWTVVDIHTPMHRALEAERAKNPDFGFTKDGVHPGREGHWMMAGCILDQFCDAQLEGIASAEQFLPAQGDKTRSLLQQRMKLRADAWMTRIGHTRPGVPGGPGVPPGPSVEEAEAKSATLTAAILALAQVRAATPDAAWSANWIGPEKSSVNQWTRYLRSFDLAEVPPQARARIAVDSKYWLWLNGELLVREGGLKRGPTPDGTYFDVVDLARALKKGSNTLAILVWHFGQHGFSHNSSGASGLVFDLDLPGGPLLGDTSWRISPHPAISTSPDTPPNRRLPESSLLFDARNDEPAWFQPGFDVSAWSAPKTFGVPPAAPWGPLAQRPIPQWKDYGLVDFSSVSRPLPARGGTITAHLPYNAQINPWIKVNAPAGREIDIRTDNFMGGSQPNIHAKYITREGIQEFEAPGWMNGHKVIYTTPEDVEILGVKFRETGYDASFTGSFTSDDPDLDKLWTKAARTLYVTMRDTYMDCPDRERSQWWGDAVNELGEVSYTFDPRAHQLTRKAIRELVDWQRPDGILYSPVPAGLSVSGSRKDARARTWYWELPVQMLASVGKYGFWTYYLQTADKETIAHAYPAVRRYLDIWQLDDRGLVIHRRGDWDWLDWGKNIDAPLLVNAWFVLALDGAIEMAHLTGNGADVPRWQALRERIVAAYNRTFWTGTAYRSPGYSGDTDDRGNALAVLAGFAEPGQFPALIQILTKHRNASPWMEKYVLEALYHMDAPDLAKQRMKERYRPQIESPLTTLWEGWEIGRHDYGGGTYNHGWGGGPLTCLSQFAAGIAPSAPGFAAFTVLPQMGTLKRVSAKVDSPRGMIEAELTRTDSSFTARVTTPPGTDGIIGVPRLAGGMPRFTIDGKPATPERSTDRHHLFRLPTGASRIVADWSVQLDQLRTSK